MHMYPGMATKKLPQTWPGAKKGPTELGKLRPPD